MHNTISHKTSIEISEKALIANVESISKILSPQTELMAVIKSNAYGHGIEIVASAISEHVDWFGVDDITEARVIRNLGIENPVLVLGYVPFEEMDYAARHDIVLTATTESYLAACFEKNISVHVKIETGLGRQGFNALDSLEIFQKYASIISGIYSHFAGAENNHDNEYTEMQFQNFTRYYESISAAIGKRVMAHIAATSGIVRSDAYHLDMVRLGIGLYGLYPSQDIKELSGSNQLVEALSWKAIVSEIKELPAGHSIGYDRTYVLARDSRIGIVPIGYWHGLPRTLSNSGHVMYESQKLPIIGRVSMDIIIIDVTDAHKLSQGEYITIVGQGISLDEVSHDASTINYEFATRINPGIPRRLV